MRDLDSSTFGERGCYELPIAAEGAAERTRDGANPMYVTRLKEVEGHYAFTFLPPDEQRRLTVSRPLGRGWALSARVLGQRRLLTAVGIAAAFCARPLRPAGHMPPAEEPAR